MTSGHTIVSPLQRKLHSAHLERMARLQKPKPKPVPDFVGREALKHFRLVCFHRPKSVLHLGTHPSDVITEVAVQHGFKFIDIISARRDHRLVAARHEAMWRCRNETTLSLLELAVIFNRDHTTVMHGIRKHESRMKEKDRESHDQKCSRAGTPGDFPWILRWPGYGRDGSDPVRHPLRSAFGLLRPIV